MPDVLALPKLFQDTQTQFSRWFRNDLTNPCDVSDIGSLGYWTSEATVTPIEDGLATAGYIIGVDATQGVQLVPSYVRFLFGRRETPKQLNKGQHGRVVFQPGDDSGRAGTWGSARQPGRNPRPLATWKELFVVFVWSIDHEAPDDELKQYESTKRLFGLVYAAMYRAAYGTIAMGNPAWVVRGLHDERFNGAELRVECTLDSPIFDLHWETITEPYPSVGYSLWVPGVSATSPPDVGVGRSQGHSVAIGVGIQDSSSEAGGAAEWLQSETGEFTVPLAAMPGQAVYAAGDKIADVADASSSSTSPAMGVIYEKPTATTATVIFAGKVSGYSGYTPGRSLFLGTNGNLIEADDIPILPGSVVQRLGVTLSANDILFQPAELTQLAS